MSYYNTPDAELIQSTDVAVTNALTEPDLLAALTLYGYGEDELTAAKDRLSAFQKAVTGRGDDLGLQVGSTESLTDARAVFHKQVYMRHVTIARVLFQDEPGTLRRLGLNGPRERAAAGWLTQAEQLYHTVGDDKVLQDRLTPRGLTPGTTAAAADELARLRLLDGRQENRKGLKQQGTLDRKGIRYETAKWISGYKQVATVALADHPEWLERIGFLNRSEK
ncbi:MAG TPA: hypothetical protein VGB53_09035 [Rubricoccaceae bacterium]|jgi:hypothetical protein